MTKADLKDKIKRLVLNVWADKFKVDDASLAYDELTNFPELKVVIVDLLTTDFDKFLESIDWVAPKPTTFRINLLNGQSFILTYNENSWIAQVEGKKYFLLNLDEEQRAIVSIARILQYGGKSETNSSEGGADIDGSEEPLDISTNSEIDDIEL